MAQWQRAVIVPAQYLEITEIYVANPTAVFAAGLRGYGDSLVIARSADHGATFTIAYEAASWRSSRILSITRVNDSLLFACGENVFVVSSDTGKSWSDISPLVPDSILSRLGTFYKLTSSASYLGEYTIITGYVGETDAIFIKFFPRTGTWQLDESRFAFDGMVAVSERVVYAFDWSYGAKKSVDTGTTFSPMYMDPLYRVYDISFTDTIVGRAVGWWFSSTTDGGATWSSKDVCRFGCSSVVFVDTLYGWTSGSTKALHRTTNGGLTWQDQSAYVDTRPLPVDWEAEHLAAIDSNIAFFGGREGLWVTFNGGVGTTSIDPSGVGEYPNGLQLSPNPAIDDITVTIPTAARGRLLIVDQEGRTVFERVVESTSSTDHTLRVSTAQFQRGVYLVLFQSADGVVAQKLLVSW